MDFVDGGIIRDANPKRHFESNSTVVVANPTKKSHADADLYNIGLNQAHNLRNDPVRLDRYSMLESLFVAVRVETTKPFEPSRRKSSVNCMRPTVRWGHCTQPWSGAAVQPSVSQRPKVSRTEGPVADLGPVRGMARRGSSG